MQPEGSWISVFGVEEKVTVATEQTMPGEGLFKSNFLMGWLRNCSIQPLDVDPKENFQQGF